MNEQNKQNPSCGAVEQIMRNVTSDVLNADGQYIQLGFTSPQAGPETWNMPNAMSSPSYLPPFIQNEASMPLCMDQFGQQNQNPLHYKYIQQPPPMYREHYENPNQMNFGLQDHNLVYSPEFKNFIANNQHNMYVPEHNYSFIQPHEGPMQNMQNRSPIIDNLVGNWAPNTSGTYSPFGNTSTFNSSNLFDPMQDLESRSVQSLPKHHHIEHNVEYNSKPEEVLHNFQFTSRDTKKPRMVAEVKPMRPSYSDVLLKSVPATPVIKGHTKSDGKDAKLKKDAKKNKNEGKISKGGSVLSRSNTSNEIKDVLNNEKSSSFNKTNERNARDSNSGGNLNRKWASLDNVSDGLNREFKHELNEGKKPKQKVESKNVQGKNQKKVLKTESNDTDSGSSKPDLTSSSTRTSVRKGTAAKVVGKQKNHEASFTNGNERSQGKRTQRTRKRESPVPFGIVGQKIMEYSSWWKYVARFFIWLFHLIADIFSLSTHLSKDLCFNCYSWIVVNSEQVWDSLVDLCKNNRLISWLYGKFKKEPEKRSNFQHSGLPNNINMPTTGEEAMKRLLACKGKDPYSILGVTPFCSDADIKNYYKKQAKLVHPDKNQQPGAEEAFKILVHAFNMIGEPERRAAYDRGVAESAQAEQAMTELTELLVQLQQKVEAAANTIRCSACGLRHKRVKVERPTYAARNCTSCKIHHAAKEGDIWAESKCFGFLWCYFACMEGGVYDITEWAACQKDSLKHLKPDSHHVQYRIALGKQAGNSSAGKRGAPNNMSFLRNTDRNAADLNNLFNNFYGQSSDGGSQTRRGKGKKTK